MPKEKTSIKKSRDLSGLYIFGLIIAGVIIAGFIVREILELERHYDTAQWIVPGTFVLCLVLVYVYLSGPAGTIEPNISLP